MNNTPKFIPLRLHTEFSITDGMVRVKDAIKQAKANHFPALGISDLMNLFGMVKFYKTCLSQGIKPIIGADLILKNPTKPDRPSRFLLIAQNHTGYLRLCELLTKAYIEEHTKGQAQIDISWLEEQDNTGLICLSGAHLGIIGQTLLNDQYEEAKALAAKWAALFPNRFYLELQRLPEQSNTEQCVGQTLALAHDLSLPVVATHPIQFLNKDDFEAHETRVCIAEGYVLGDSRRPKNFHPSQYFISHDEFIASFSDIPEALTNSLEIAKRCNLEITLGKNFLPLFPTPEGITLDEYMMTQAQEGLETRAEILYPDETERNKVWPELQQRLKFEIDTIIQMGFSGYFLIVADFINWAKNNGCPVGPGRGSGAGSLVAFALGITDLNPLDYALLFERFLNPERVSMPDFDIDFCQDNRGRVIDYVRERYGHDAVSQIITFGTLASKAVVRDVGRVLQMPYSMCDELSKLIPAAPGKQYSLDDAVQMEPQLQAKLEDEEIAKLWSLAKKLEGLTRNVGMHAGGVLIAPGKLTDFCPLYQADGGVPVSQFDKDDVEQIGLVKFDFLGLRNLTIIQMAVDFIKGLHPDLTIDLNTLPLTDTAAYKLLAKGNTTGVFQLESDGMKGYLTKLHPDRFEDIVAMLALYRPGPLGSGMVETFINRKKGIEKPDYFHPDLTACLEPTYGVIVYQEQVMQISQIIGGYTLGGADMLRRAMGKKKPEEMAKHRDIFINGAKEKGYDEKLAEHLFDLMAMFAEYGFNKSHSAAYALVTYHTAWLKAHYPAAFMAATMSCELDNTDQLKIFYDDCLANKLIFLPPSINHSFYKFTPINDKEIRYALGAIKGTGEAAVNEIVAEREANGSFSSLFDFCERMGKTHVNKRSLEALIKAGAFDEIDPNRAKLFNNIALAMEHADQALANKNQGSLFDLDETITEEVQMEDYPAWDDITLLAEEKQSLGFYLSNHPFSAYAKEVRAFIKQPLKKIVPKEGTQTLAGFVTAIRTKVGKRGKMAFITLEDQNDKLEVSVFGEVYEQNATILKADQVMIIEAKVSKDMFNGGDSVRIIADKIYDLEKARLRFARGLLLKVSHQHNATQIMSLLQSYQGKEYGVSLKINYQNQEASGDLAPNHKWLVTPESTLINQLEQILGKQAVEVIW
ncbi:DNA polymerase III subunit alpha [Neisseria sp. Ec49-e6-T10]|uniref:DNA polymerase III subunit alpha n=1 Tax=Neisseria sp. Ec49-e6-T10 TaxID=3140744 RepID=UPI003EB79DB7